ncbi:nucleotidyltransferase domain-containing protein [Actinophytocola algeriensis]|uniref:Putative nucleotidyltransferase n=1 Tax=Actinophytocola algeriensis TaxID=1768010 RepID=A0A7W7VBM6_9PSEU|nr:nucleotidyltransferase domain-containing protein [Actinophytocola algeriensis]MBB4904288.1 putative nucleotidyltransferase [Actinophytocola algeriensis]MBE1476854.1 putative nucleotidyltransferase [Actinophytocola algeriensis]
MELNRPLATITPTLDGDVLTVLARQGATFTTGQVHRILTQHSEEGIRKVLRRLNSQGIVLSERIGNAFAYRFNQDHLAAQHIVGLARIQETFLASLEDLLKSWRIPPVYAAVFGSAARGQMTTSSDIDLLLVRPHVATEPEWEDQVNTLATKVTKWLGNDVRVLEFTEGEIATRGREEPVLDDALREGLTVAGSRSWLNKQLRRGNS